MPGGEDLSVVGNTALSRKKFGATQDQPVLRTGVDRAALLPGGQDWLETSPGFSRSSLRSCRFIMVSSENPDVQHKEASRMTFQERPET